MKYLFTTFLFCLAGILPGWAQQGDPLTYSLSLQEAIEYAQKNQTTVQNALIDVEIAKNDVKRIIGIGLPQVSGSASFSDYVKIPTSLLPGEFFGQPGVQVPVQFGVKYQSSAGLELNQLLFDGTYLVGLQASKTYKELSNKNLRRTRIETAVAVSKAYYTALVRAEYVQLLDGNIARLKKPLSDTEAMFKNGFVESIDVDRLKVLSNNLETERENVVRLLALTVDLLKFQMGMPIETPLALKDKLSDLESFAKIAMVTDTTAYQSRIEYSLLQTQKRVNEYDLKRYKSLLLPSLSGFVNASNNYQSNDFSPLFNVNYPVTIIGLRLTVPIISGGQKLYQIRNAKLQVERTENDLVNLKNGINLEVSEAQATYVNGVRSLENQKRNMGLADEVLRVSRIKYEQGVGSSLEVTTAETSLQESQNNYITALYDLLISKINLDRATGKIVY